MCLTTTGVTVMEPMRRVVCLYAWSTNQNKALTGAQFSCGAASLCCPARPGTFLITIQSLSVYTISGDEWTVAQGSPWEALQRSALPCRLPPSPPSVHAASPNNPTLAADTHSHKHTVTEPPPLSHTQLKPWESVLLLSPSYLLQILKPFVVGILHHRGTVNC